jgi:hypothetical protein
LPLVLTDTTFDHALYLAAGDPADELDPELRVTWATYTPLLPETPPRAGPLVYVCHEVKVEFMTMAKNNVMTNFYRCHIAW